MRQSQTRRPLFDLDLEASVLGAVLSQNRHWHLCLEVTPDHFEDTLNQHVWKILCERLNNNKRTSAATLAPHISSFLEGQDARGFLSDLQSYGEGTDPDLLRDYIQRLLELAQWRKLQQCHALIGNLLTQAEGKADRAIDKAVKHLMTLSHTGNNTAQNKRSVIAKMRQNYLTPPEPTPTCIEPLDILFNGGLISGRSYGIGAPFGRGKTVLVGSISDNLNRTGHKHLVISAETPPEDIEIRNAARHMNLNATNITDGNSPRHKAFIDRIEQYENSVPDNTLYEYTPGIDLDTLLRIIRRNIYQHKIKGFLLDYLQVIQGKERGQSELNHLNTIATRLNTLCREENIWCILMVQAEEGNRSHQELDQIRKPLSTFVRMQRDPNDSGIVFNTEKNNYGRLAHAGDMHNPGAVFDMRGPHIRNTCESDHAQRTQSDD